MGSSEKAEIGLKMASIFIQEAMMEIMAHKTPLLLFKWLVSNSMITIITRMMVAFCIRTKCFKNDGFALNP
jgi:hypothetical protein